MSTTLLAFIASVFLATVQGATAIPSGNYTLTVRQTSGPLSDAYTAKLTVPVVIATTGAVTIGNWANIPCTMDGSILESGPTAITETRGKLAGTVSTKQLSINVVDGTAAGGTICYTIDEDGKTKSGICTFTLAAK